MRGRADSSRQATLGLRRIDLVRITVGAASTTCEVVGIGHRVRRTCTVPLATGLRLRDAGVPTVVRSPRRGTTTTQARRAG